MYCFKLLTIFYILTFSNTALSVAITAQNSDDLSTTFSVSISSPVIDISLTISKTLNKAADVTCSLLNPAWFANGLAGSFSIGTIAVSKSSITIHFTCISAGNYRKFKCFFTDLAMSSYSPEYIMQCTSAPIVNVCPNTATFLPSSTTSITYLPLRFSEIIMNSSVVVSCSSSNFAVILPSSSITILPGKKNSKVSFKYGSSTASSILQCQVTSVTGSQYISTYIGSTCHLTFGSPSVNIFPQNGYLSSQSFVFLFTTNFVTSNVFFRCRAVLSTKSLMATVLDDKSCPDREDTPASNSYWLVTPSRIEITSSIHMLNVSRSLYPSSNEAGQTDLVVVICCNPSSTGVYANLRETAVYTVSLDNMRLNTTKFIATKSGKTIPTLPNPAFVEPAPCPCDLTNDLCDAGCCCDQQCAHFQPLPCISGVYGGEQVSTDETACSVQNKFNLPGYHPFLCNIFNNSVTLGLFYDQVGVALTPKRFAENLATAGTPFRRQGTSLDSGKRAYHQLSSSDVALVRGDPLRLCLVQYNLGSGDLEQDPACHLSAIPLQLPTNLGSTVNDCQSVASVRFLEAFNEGGVESCSILLTRNLCLAANTLDLVPGQGASSNSIDGSRIHARSYLLGSRASDRICPPFFRTLVDRTPSNGSITIVVNYFCLSHAELIARGHLASETQPSSNPQTGFYSQTCVFDQATLITNCTPVDASGAATPVPHACSWDMGAVNPPAPRLSGNVCSNTVVGVSYEFSWVTAGLSSLEANIYLGNINVAVPVTVYQNFTASFKPEGSFQEFNADLLVHRSGFQGYDQGLTLVTGTATNIGSTNRFFVTLKSSEGMKSTIGLPLAGLKNSCEAGSIFPPAFKVDSQSNCYLYLPLSEFEDCQKLRSLVLSGVDRFFDFNVVAQTGNPSLSNSSQWVFLQKPKINFLADSASLEDVKNECSRIPAGINLRIFYAKTGEFSGELIEKIVGAQISYDLVAWRFECPSGEATSACNQAQSETIKTTLSNPFLLSVSLSFINVPADWPKAVRFIRNSDLLPPSTCTKQHCWRDAFSPWWTFFNLNKGGELASIVTAKRIAISIVFGTFGIVLLILAWPVK